MDETWHAVFDAASGELRSLGTVVADPLPEGLASKPFPFDPRAMVWRPVERDFVQPPPVAAPRRLSPVEFAKLLTVGERIALRKSSDPVIEDFQWFLERAEYIDLDDAITQQGIGYLTTLAADDPARLTEARAARILAGLPPEA